MPNVPRDARQEFVQKHIPGARYLDLDEVATPHEMGLKHMMPPSEVFAEYCGMCSSCIFLYGLVIQARQRRVAKNGISPSSHVVM